MYRRVLVPLDGSAISARGVREAAGLAKAQGARLRLLNVLDERFFLSDAEGYAMSNANVTELMASLRAAGQKALDEASKAALRQRVKVDTSLIEGRGRLVSDVILDEARKWRADLIVMGTHGRRGINRMLLGSDAERVLRSAPVPVLLVRSEEKKVRTTRKRRRTRSA
jgi:nucleotide-binding universal stress UspA family protein